MESYLLQWRDVKKKKKKKAAKKKKGGFQIEILPTDTILLCKNLSYREGMYF